VPRSTRVDAMDPAEILTRPAPPPDATIKYGPGLDHIADVRRPSGGGPRGASAGSGQPLVVVLHGSFGERPLTASTSGRWQRPSRPRATSCACRSAGSARPAAAGQGLSTMSRRRWAGCRPWSQPLRRAPAPRAAIARWPFRRRPSGPLGGGAAGRRAAPDYRAMGPGARTRGRSITGVAALAPVSDLVACHRQRLGGGTAADLLGGGPEQHPQRYAVADPAA
jgi:hypothetical protein